MTQTANSTQTTQKPIDFNHSRVAPSSAPLLSCFGACAKQRAAKKTRSLFEFSPGRLLLLGGRNLLSGEGDSPHMPPPFGGLPMSNAVPGSGIMANTLAVNWRGSYSEEGKLEEGTPSHSLKAEPCLQEIDTPHRVLNKTRISCSNHFHRGTHVPKENQ